MDEATKEQKFSCGCHIVDGALVAECTQVAPQGEISAAQHASNKPFARKCARKAAIEHEKCAAEERATIERKNAEKKAADAKVSAALVQAEVSNPAIPVSDDKAVGEVGAGMEVHPASE